jgi:LysM repeat protein
MREKQIEGYREGIAMKSNGKVLTVALHTFVVAVFLLMQGCATGDCPVDWLNWPYNAPSSAPLVLPVDNGDFSSSDGFSDTVLLPPVFDSAPMTSIIEEPTYVAPTYEAPAPAYVAPTSSSSDQVYTVRKGDTLSAIASMYGTTWKKLAQYNNLSNPNRLVVGQEIQISGSYSASTPVVRPSKPAVRSSSSRSSSKGSIEQGSSYVIQRGDTLSGIAQRAGLKVSEIKSANGLSSNFIIAGKSLSIPMRGDVSSSVPSYSAPVDDFAPAPVMDFLPPVIEPVQEVAPSPVTDFAPLEPVDDAPVYEHVLYPGETLEDVARQHSSSVEAIMILNGLTSFNDVTAGTKLLVPLPE